MKNLAKSTIALIAAGLVIAALAGALVATALDGDDDDRDDEQVVLSTSDTAAATAPPTDAGAAVADTTVAEPDDIVVDADDVPLGKAEADRVAKAAVAAAGGGTVTEVNRSDDPGEAYEVEVLTDAGEVDVALDSNLKRVSNNPYDD